MGVIRETAAAALSLWLSLCGCLSATEGTADDGGPDDGDGGTVDADAGPS